MDAILGKLAMVKIVSLNKVGFKYVNCTGELLAKNILEVLGANLDQLSIKCFRFHSWQQEELMEKIVGNSSFSNLKTLKLPHFHANYVKMLLSRAPNLSTLETEGGFSPLEENVLESRSTVVWRHGFVNYPWVDIPEEVIPSLRLDDVFLECDSFEKATFDFEDFNRKMPRILRSCYSTTLRTVDLDVKFAVPLMTYGISFENVERLEMRLDYRILERHEPAVLEIVKNFDFTRIFPTLTSVRVNEYEREDYEPSPDSFHRLLQLPLWGEPRPDRVVNITEIFLCGIIGLSECSARFFAQMFPAVQKIVYYDAFGSNDFGLIARHWPGLKELEIHHEYSFDVSDNKNLDSIYCGVSPKEVALLREMDEGELKNLNIVPVESAITCMKDLQSLQITFDGGSTETALTMTKVTGLTAFSKLRCPNLEVTILAYPATCQALSYMAPFASIFPLE